MRKIARKVKCYYCGHMFDRDKEETYQVNGRRYAHLQCHQRAEQLKSEEEKDKEKLENYIKKLFDYKTLPEHVKKQIKQYVNEFHYTYSGILKTLIYFYEIRHGDKEKAYGRIGIVQYVYDEANRYYYSLWEAQQANANLLKQQEQQYINIETREVKIPPPKRTKYLKKKKDFSFLNEEREDNNE